MLSGQSGAKKGEGGTIGGRWVAFLWLAHHFAPLRFEWPLNGLG